MPAADVINQCQDYMAADLDDATKNTMMKGAVADYYNCDQTLLPNDLTTLLSLQLPFLDDSRFASHLNPSLEANLAIKLLWQFAIQETYTMASSDDQLKYRALFQQLLMAIPELKTHTQYAEQGTETEFDENVADLTPAEKAILSADHSNKPPIEKADDVFKQLTTVATDIDFRSNMINLFTQLRALVYQNPMHKEYDPKVIYVNTSFNMANSCSAGVFPMALIKDVDQENKNLGKLVDEVINVGIQHYRKIRGDGNCYYRSLMMNTLEQLIIAAPDERRMRFNYLADSLEKLKIFNLLSNSEFELPLEYAYEHGRLIEKLRLAAEGKLWRSLQELDSDLLVQAENEDGLDHALIIAARYGLAQAVYKARDTELNEMKVCDSVIGEHNNLEHYIESVILKMGQCAEGIGVNLALLDEVLGINSQIVILPRDKNSRVALIEQEAQSKSEIIMRDGLAPLYVKLLLRPGHYDILYPNGLNQDLNNDRAAANADLLEQLSSNPEPSAVIFGPNLERQRIETTKLQRKRVIETKAINEKLRVLSRLSSATQKPNSNLQSNAEHTSQNQAVNNDFLFPDPNPFDVIKFSFDNADEFRNAPTPEVAPLIERLEKGVKKARRLYPTRQNEINRHINDFFQWAEGENGVEQNQRHLLDIKQRLHVNPSEAPANIMPTEVGSPPLKQNDVSSHFYMLAIGSSLLVAGLVMVIIGTCGLAGLPIALSFIAAAATTGVGALTAAAGGLMVFGFFEKGNRGQKTVLNSAENALNFC